jgi:phosphatidylglycerol:prolipoprotein diacylglycerol transferase
MPWAVIFPNEEGENCIRGITEICGRHPSQLYEAILEGLILGLILFWGAYFKSWLKTPGFSISIFFIGYGIARFFVEIFRQPDTYYITESNPFGYMIQMTNFGLTSGQVLSIPMVLIGIFIMIKALRIL